jgi:PAS domain-containing protein
MDASAIPLGLIFFVLAVAVATAAATVMVAAWIGAQRARKARARRALPEKAATVAFLFEDELMRDATPSGRALLEGAPGEGSDWARLSGLLRHRFPGLDEALAGLAETGQVTLKASDGTGDRLTAEWVGHLARVTLVPATGLSERSGRAVEEQTIAAMEAEIATLRGVAENAPIAVWKQALDGTVVWANNVYFALAAEMHGPEAAQSWPPPRLFPQFDAGLPDTGFALAPVRTALRTEDGAAARWFDCLSFPAGEHTLCYATPIDDLVHAEEALREFVQTLSKTFAHLPIGLAVFDRARRLALFNPALTDLTGLEVDFLAARPTLFAFLDRLRDRRRLPEPRDYASWRQRMADLEAAAAGGFVQENWALPSGQTYRVTGRPHPDGAVAFLFEDISAEVSLTRRFRSELELGQTVLDSLDEAIAVFSPQGDVAMTNAAYVRLWGIDPASTLAACGVVETTRQWQSLTVPTPVWGDARDFVTGEGERAEWSETVAMTDGRILYCRFVPLAAGATLVGFTVATGEGGSRRLRSADPAEAGAADASAAGGGSGSRARARA